VSCTLNYIFFVDLIHFQVMPLCFLWKM
jgi:hypothetical protein